MINEYTSNLTKQNLINNLPKELIELRNEYRDDGIPTILSDGLNELLLLCKLKNPKKILELGTSVGCSGIAMLLTLKNAKLLTVEKFENVSNQAQENFKKFGVYDRAKFLVGDSLDVTKNIKGKFDFIFLDCNKAAYTKLYPYLKNMLNSGGVIVADNVLFRGYVSKEQECPKIYRTLTEKINRYNLLVNSDTDMITTVFDVGDGIAVSVKK